MGPHQHQPSLTSVSRELHPQAVVKWTPTASRNRHCYQKQQLCRPPSPCPGAGTAISAVLQQVFPENRSRIKQPSFPRWVSSCITGCVAFFIRKSKSSAELWCFRYLSSFAPCLWNEYIWMASTARTLRLESIPKPRAEVVLYCHVQGIIPFEDFFNIHFLKCNSNDTSIWVSALERRRPWQDNDTNMTR